MRMFGCDVMIREFSIFDSMKAENILQLQELTIVFMIHSAQAVIFIIPYGRK